MIIGIFTYSYHTATPVQVVRSKNMQKRSNYMILFAEDITLKKAETQSSKQARRIG